jgi:hypothetical protein
MFARTRFVFRLLGWGTLIYLGVYGLVLFNIWLAVFLPDLLIFGPGPLSRTFTILWVVCWMWYFGRDIVKLIRFTRDAIRAVRHPYSSKLIRDKRLQIRTIDDLIAILDRFVLREADFTRAKEFLRSSEYYYTLGIENAKLYTETGDVEALERAAEMHKAAVRQLRSYDEIMRDLWRPARS